MKLLSLENNFNLITKSFQTLRDFLFICSPFFLCHELDFLFQAFNEFICERGTDGSQDQERETNICEAGDDYYKCKPQAVEFLASLANRDGDKIMIVSFDERHTRLAICAPQIESQQTSPLTNQINLMSHVFCRQMGYMTYTSRRASNLMDEKQQSVWPSAVCNGTEQRLQDCMWPYVSLTACKHVLEVNCGDCSKYYNHVDDGIILSPGFPNSFPFTVQCDWVIFTQLGAGIELKFTVFNLPTPLLPMAMVGASDCVASNAFLEIRPKSSGAVETSVEAETLSNSQRFCVTRHPERKITIKSKAVWLHFSSGIHSAFFWSFFRSQPFLIRPIGLKIHFRALPADVPEDEETSIRPYVALGISAAVVLLFFTTASVWICFRIRNGKRPLTLSQRSSSAPEETPHKWRRNRCSPDDRKASNNNKADISPHNYEEIPVRPVVPPRTMTASQADRKQAAGIKHSQRTVHLSRRSPPTYGSEHYMQIVCDPDGNCQYIPRGEIPDSVFLPPATGRHHSVPEAVVASISGKRILSPLPERREHEPTSACDSLPPYCRAVRSVCSVPEGASGRVARSKSFSGMSAGKSGASIEV